MKLSKIIVKLQAILDRHGDLEVCVADWGNRHDQFEKAPPPQVVKVKRHCSGFYRADSLRDGGFAGGNAFTQPYQREIEARPDQTIVLMPARS